MSRERFLVMACAVAVLAAGMPMAAQSLGDVAKKEEARRKGVTEPAKVYTNKDLKPTPQQAAQQEKTDDKAAADKSAAQPANDKAAPKSAGDAPAEKGAADKGAADKSSGDAAAPPKTEPAKDAAYWAGRMKALQEQLDRDETYLAAMQSRINGLTTDFINRDDPAQKRALEQERLKAIGELDRLKQAVPKDKKAIDDLREEARRAGVPPGWLR